MSEGQSDFFFSMLEHAIVPVRATEFAEVETGLKGEPSKGLTGVSFRDPRNWKVQNAHLHILLRKLKLRNLWLLIHTIIWQFWKLFVCVVRSVSVLPFRFNLESRWDYSTYFHWNGWSREDLLPVLQSSPNCHLLWQPCKADLPCSQYRISLENVPGVFKL